MKVTDAGMATLVNELHALKAYMLMLVTDVGMATRVNELHPSKANRPMHVTDVGIITLATSLLSTPHSFQESCSSKGSLQERSGSGWVILEVPSGIAKCKPSLDCNTAVVVIVLVFAAPGKAKHLLWRAV